MSNPVFISAVVITFNEARNIGRCLDSLAGIADDVVVLDSFSGDETERICREKGARFFQNPFLNYSDQKNRANALAEYDMILSLDADEALSEPLKAAIMAVKNQGISEAYDMSRLTNYCGKWIKHSGWYPDRKVRLFDRRRAHWGGPNPHEVLILDAGIKPVSLSGDILHYSYYTVKEHLRRARKYADMASEALRAQGKKASMLQVLGSPAFKFFRNYILRLGFLDGRAGFTICRISALETYWKYNGLR